jgi:signal transduction histidine kinase
MKHYIVGRTSDRLRRRPPGGIAVNVETDRLQKLRFELSNPLSALLAETQLLLLNESRLDPETLKSLREIEGLAIRARAILRDA